MLDIEAKCVCNNLVKNHYTEDELRINSSTKTNNYFKKEGKYCTYTDNIIFLKDTPHIKFINSSSPSLTKGEENIVKGILDKNHE